MDEPATAVSRSTFREKARNGDSYLITSLMASGEQGRVVADALPQADRWPPLGRLTPDGPSGRSLEGDELLAVEGLPHPSAHCTHPAPRAPAGHGVGQLAVGDDVGDDVAAVEPTPPAGQAQLDGGDRGDAARRDPVEARVVDE